MIPGVVHRPVVELYHAHVQSAQEKDCENGHLFIPSVLYQRWQLDGQDQQIYNDQ